MMINKNTVGFAKLFFYFRPARGRVRPQFGPLTIGPRFRTDPTQEFQRACLQIIIKTEPSSAAAILIMRLGYYIEMGRT
jgi:hypothetical protein